MEGLGVGCAAAGAVEARPALAALFLGKNIVGCEFLLQISIEGAVKDAAHAVAFAADELVAGVDVAIGGHGNVLIAGAAAGEALAQAGAAGQIHIEVEEVQILKHD